MERRPAAAFGTCGARAHGCARCCIARVEPPRYGGFCGVGTAVTRLFSKRWACAHVRELSGIGSMLTVRCETALGESCSVQGAYLIDA